MTRSPKPMPGEEPEYLPGELMSAPDRFTQGFMVGVAVAIVGFIIVLTWSGVWA